MSYHFNSHKEPNGYWAECCELEGCVTQADTLEELYASCEESLHIAINDWRKGPIQHWRL